VKIIKPYLDVYEDLTDPVVTGQMLMKLDEIGRTCYKSKASDAPESAGKFVRKLIERGHEAMLEHVSISVKFVVDRGVSHELVRHRMASFAQESTRYCNYSQDKFGNEITVIEPVFFNNIYDNKKKTIREAVDNDGIWESKDNEFSYCNWYLSCMEAEKAYFKMLKDGSTPQEARSVLPNSLKTEIWMTCNLREWRHVMKLRAAGTTGKPHPQMAEVMIPLLEYFKNYLPDVFFDIDVPE